MRSLGFIGRTALSIAVAMLGSLPGLSPAQPTSVTLAEREAIAAGGRLYDKWWVEARLSEPSGMHPAYPAAGKATGSGTWRCKECHGWDYKGKDGAYSKGSHFTGIAGIAAYAGRPTADVVAVLKDKTHQFDRVMNAAALTKLAQFVSQGQVDMDAHIDRATKQARSDVQRGKVVYGKNCARCHGDDGRDLNFGKPDKPEFVGTVAKDNPWETLHKVRNGHPGAAMGPKQMHSGNIMRRHLRGEVRMGEQMPAAGVELGIEDQAALLAYLQTLPE